MQNEKRFIDSRNDYKSEREQTKQVSPRRTWTMDESNGTESVALTLSSTRVSTNIMYLKSTSLNWVANTTSGRLLASSQWINIGKWQLRWTKSTSSIGNTTWWRILGLLHGHIPMNCSLGLIFLQRKLRTWKLLIGPSVGGLQECYILPPPSREAIVDVVAESYTICFWWNRVPVLPKWIWSKERHGLGIMPMHLPPDVLD
jgi:hypothetical protein